MKTCIVLTSPFACTLSAICILATPPVLSAQSTNAKTGPTGIPRMPDGRPDLSGVWERHTEALHVVEHFRRTDAAHIAYDVTITDPGAYTRSWKNVRTFTLRPDWEIRARNLTMNGVLK